MLRNPIATAGIVTISTAYLWLASSLVPDKYALIVNFAFVPLLIGMVAGYVFIGSVVTKLLFLLVVPVVHVLVFGGDPAKPGLENLLGLVELAPLYLGCIVVHLLLARKGPPKARAGA